MQGKDKKGIIILVGIVLVALVVILVMVMGSKNKEKTTGGNVTGSTSNLNTDKYATNIEDGVKINNSTEFNKNKKYNNIEFSNIQFTFEEGRSVLLTDIKNTGSTKHNAEIVKITILDEKNQTIDVLSPAIPDMEAGETRQLSVIITGKDAVNAKDFKIEAK